MSLISAAEPAVLASVFCAACTGSNRLSGLLGRPVVLVGATGSAFDAAVAMRLLNEARHGCGVRWPGSFQPLHFEGGWDDWDFFPMESCQRRAAPRPAGARFDAGRILVPLARGVSFQEFEAQLAAALRHLRVQEVAMRPDFLEERSDMLADVAVHPRYTPTRSARPGGYPDFRGCRLVTDLYALDAAEDAGRLFWLAVGAALAAGDGARPSWR